MTQTKKTKVDRPDKATPEVEVIPLPLEARDFESVLAEIRDWMVSTEAIPGADLTGDFLVLTWAERVQALSQRASDEHASGNVESSWSFLADALATKARLLGYARGMDAAQQRALEKQRHGREGGDKKSILDLEKTEALIDLLTQLPGDPSWSSGEVFKAVLTKNGKAAGIQMTDLRLERLSNHPRIKRIREAATKKGRQANVVIHLG